MKDDEKSDFRMLALGAKRRMKDGYWQRTNALRENAIQNMRSQGKNTVIAQNYYITRLSNELYGRKPNGEDDALYKKVCRILENCADTENPIGMLVDKNIYDKLDANSKQRYIFKLADKYRQLKNRYYTEQQMCARECEIER